MVRIGLRALWSRPQSSGRISEQLEINGLSIIWHRSTRRTRSLALKLDRQGRLVAMTPMATTQKELQRLIRTRQAWIAEQQNKYSQLEYQRNAEQGKTAWYLGQSLQVEALVDKQSKVVSGDGILRVYSRRELQQTGVHKRVASWLREQASTYLSQRLEVCSEQSGIEYSGVQIKAYRARWGSCRHNGLIQLNWKLIQTPPDVIDYVIYHELCHRLYFNHSPDFWAQVERVCPHYRQQRKWLKQHGSLMLTT